MSFATVLPMVMGGIKMIAQQKAVDRQIAARNRETELQREELRRRKERADEIAREEKADLRRKTDRDIATVLAAGADGGVTAAALARQVVAIAGVAGLERARVESNRQEAHAARTSKGIAIVEEARAANQAARDKKTGIALDFFGNAAGTFAESGGFNISSTSRATNQSFQPSKQPFDVFD